MVKKMGLLSLVMVLFLCSACSKDDSQNVDMQGSGVVLDGSIAILEKIAEGKEKDIVSEWKLWSKHAFLLEDEDVFFVNMPDEWRGFWVSDPMQVRIYCPDENVLSDGWREFFELSVSKAVSVSEQAEDFLFGDGKIGRKYVIDNDHMNQYKNLKREGSHTECILSEDGKYVFCAGGLTNGQYELYLEYSEKFYNDIMFLDGQVGLEQTEDIWLRENVELHTSIPFCFDAIVPEGIFLKIEDYGMSGSSLFFYLSEHRDAYIEVYYDRNGVRGDIFYEAYGKRVTDLSYKELAEYVVKTTETDKIIQYNFVNKNILAEVHVPEGDEEMLEAALDIVRSIRFQ